MAALVARAALLVALGALTLGAGPSTTLLDFVSFDGIDYIRWLEEPGRALTRNDLGEEFATIACSFGEDLRGCPYGVDAGAAFMPAGTRIYAVRGYRTEFRLAAVWNSRIFLYQAWRNPRAKVGADLFPIAGKVRAIDVSRGDPTPENPPVAIASPGDVEAIVRMIVEGPTHRPSPHPAAEPHYWLTIWLTDGTTLGRPYFVDTSELMGGVVLPAEFRTLLERSLTK